MVKSKNMAIQNVTKIRKKCGQYSKMHPKFKIRPKFKNVAKIQNVATIRNEAKI